MTDLQKFQRACRVFLARLLMVHGQDAPDGLRRIADELEWLADSEREGRANGRDDGWNGRNLGWVYSHQIPTKQKSAVRRF